MAEIETPLSRMNLLVGEDKVKSLQNKCVMIVGVGGVGSYAAEAIARMGVGKIILVDKDKIAYSNLNRQIHATFNTINQDKCEAMKDRILSFRNDCEVICKSMFYSEENNDEIFDCSVDFVVDAIDTMSSKMALIQYCIKNKIPFISSMGMANRLDPTKIVICDLMKTTYDPVAKIMRNLVRKNKINAKIPVVFSSEQPITQTKVINEEGTTRKEKMPPASSPFVPCAAGLAIASYVLKKLVNI